MPNITAKIIADMLGISPAAVSFALNNKPGVSAKTRELILEKARSLGYVTTSKQSSQVVTKTICYLVVVGELTSVLEHSTFSTLVLQGLEKTAAAAGFATTVRYLNISQLQNPQTLEYFSNVNGVVLLATDLGVQHGPLLKPLMRTIGNTPLIITDNDAFSDIADTICNDNSAAARTAIQHLAERGCKTIGYIRSRRRIPTLDARERGTIGALSEFNLTPHTIWSVSIESDNAYTDMLKLLESNPDLPDGFFVENDVMAVAAIRAMQTKGISVPNKVSIIGVDDAPVAEMVIPQLSTIRSHATEMGEWAMRLILARQQERDQPKAKPYIQVHVKTRLVERDSVRKFETSLD